MIALIVFVLFMWALPSPAATYNAATCGAADVQAAIDLATSQGDVVQIPAGSCTWTISVHINANKGITLQGAGEGSTIITDGMAHNTALYTNNCTITASCGWGTLLYVGFDSANTHITRVTAMTFIPFGTDDSTNYMLWVHGTGVDKYRIDHLTFDGDMKRRAIAVVTADGGVSEFSGVVDHVTCHHTGTNGAQCFNVNYASDAFARVFKQSVELGTNSVPYWEDLICTFDNVKADSCFDNYDGHGLVLRYSAFSGIGNGNHGVDSGKREARQLEYYRNTYTNSGANLAQYHNFRTGPNIIFDETYSGPSTGVYNISIYRTSSSNTFFGTPGGNCTGANSYDGNIGTAEQGNEGYPCLGQVGWYFPAPAGCSSQATCNAANGSNAIHNPAYVWNNVKSGSSQRLSTGSYPAAYVHINSATAPSKIDIYDDVSASCSGASCTVGIGRGTLTNRPASCTTGVAYWATDQGNWNKIPGGEQGVLYKCTATDTWTLYYTPYEYPHPLQEYVPSTQRFSPDFNLRRVSWEENQ